MFMYNEISAFISTQFINFCIDINSKQLLVKIAWVNFFLLIIFKVYQNILKTSDLKKTFQI